MKKLLSMAVALTVLVAFTVPSFAMSTDKIQGGFKRVMQAPFQVTDNMKAEGDSAKFMPFGLTGGFLKGCFYMVKEMVGGTMDIVTSPVEMMNK